LRRFSLAESTAVSRLPECRTETLEMRREKFGRFSVRRDEAIGTWAAEARAFEVGRIEYIRSGPGRD
jgi:hypothetical protein